VSVKFLPPMLGKGGGGRAHGHELLENYICCKMNEATAEPEMGAATVVGGTERTPDVKGGAEGGVRPTENKKGLDTKGGLKTMRGGAQEKKGLKN